MKQTLPYLSPLSLLHEVKHCFVLRQVDALDDLDDPADAGREQRDDACYEEGYDPTFAPGRRRGAAAGEECRERCPEHKVGSDRGGDSDADQEAEEQNLFLR